MTTDWGAFNEFGLLAVVAVRSPQNAFVSDSKLDAEWRELNYHTKPDLAGAMTEYQEFRRFLEAAGCDIIELPAANELTIDALYTRDSLIVTPKGIVKPRMGKPQRRAESAVNGAALSAKGYALAGEISGHGKVEGGDLVWLDAHTLLAGIGYRTNLEGIRQLQKIVGPEVSVIAFDLPHHKGTGDVFHLMSVLSPVDRDLAVVFPPLMPVRLVEFLQERGVQFVEVPEAEFSSMGCNVLAIAPRHVIMVDGNPETAARMRASGVKVIEIRANEISRKGEGGPTCMTRPLRRI